MRSCKLLNLWIQFSNYICVEYHLLCFRNDGNLKYMCCLPFSWSHYCFLGPVYMFIYAEWMYLLFVANNVCNDRFQTEGLHQHQMLPCLFSKDKTGSVFMKYLVSTEFPHVCYLTGIWTFVAGNFNSSARATLCTYT